MKTWGDVREKIKSISPVEKKEIELSAELIAQFVSRRKELGLSQRDLSEISGLKQTAIARLESRKSVPRIDTFARLVDSIGLEIKLVESNKPNRILANHKKGDMLV